VRLNEEPVSLVRAPEAARAYARLKARVAAAGLMERSRLFYALLIFFAFSGYLVCASAIVLLESYAYLTLACLAFTFFTIQVAGLMHDAGHRAVFASTRANDVLGSACSFLVGMVFDGWRSRHNTHHAHPNDEDQDPDMEIPFIAATEVLFQRKGGLQRRLARHQALYYYPLGGLVSFTNRLGSITYFLRRGFRGRLHQLLPYLAGVAVLFFVPFLVFAPAKAAFVVLLVHVSTGLYLANCFAPNHKGMPAAVRSSGLTFIEQQVVTARNVRGGFLTELLLVGLNHQIEHHLFPSCPRNKLRLLRPYVRQTCLELGLPYTEAGFIESNRALLQTLRDVPRRATWPSPA
jgi:fatty acid desaturase